MLKLAYVFEGFTPCFYKSDTVVGRYENEMVFRSRLGFLLLCSWSDIMLNFILEFKIKIRFCRANFGYSLK